MSTEVQHQFYFLFLSFVWGMETGWIYDGFRVFRKIIPHSRRFLNAEDFIYWLLITAQLFYLVFTYHYGEIRDYIVFGLILGHVFYYKIISPVYQMLMEVLFSPIRFLVICLKRILRKMTTKLSDRD